MPVLYHSPSHASTFDGRFAGSLISIRRALGEAAGRLRHEGDTLALESIVVDADTACFERLVSAGTPQALAEAATLLSMAALRLHRG
jgi:hypothetical protein